MDAHRPTDATELSLVIGGTGMLRPAVHTLIERGHDVAVVARRPERSAPAAGTTGRLLPIAGNWREPSSLADRIRATVHDRRVRTVIVWVHEPHRHTVMERIETEIAADATVVHVWGSAGQDPRRLVPRLDPAGRRSVRHVVLGYLPLGTGARWLTDVEISAAVLRALETEELLTIAGRIEPWDRRPGRG